MPDLTDEELHAQGKIRVPIGPFGMFGYKIMTIKQFNRKQAQAARRDAARRRKRHNARVRKAKRLARKAVTGKAAPSKKQRKWIIPGLLYWE